MSISANQLRLGVYCDFSYRIGPDGLTAELPFSLFIDELGARCAQLIVLGRLDPSSDPFPFALSSATLQALPYYDSGANLAAVIAGLPKALVRFWRTLGRTDVVWVLGPNPPQAILLALLGRARGRRVVLGVRQNLPELIRHRRPGHRAVIAAADALEWAFRRLARRLPVVVVGPALAEEYGAAGSLLEIYVSLVSARSIAPVAPARDYDSDELVMLSVGRLDPEKNPLMLADVLRSALDQDPRWRLQVVGEGTMTDALRHRARELGVSDRLVMCGYVPIDDGLWKLYERAHVLLHVSLTEGVPQVILEAFAVGLPVVATAVGGVGGLVEGRGLLIPPGDPASPADAVNRIASDGALRDRLVSAALTAVGDHTLEAEAGRVLGFLSTNS